MECMRALHWHPSMRCPGCSGTIHVRCAPAHARRHQNEIGGAHEMEQQRRPRVEGEKGLPLQSLKHPGFPCPNPFGIPWLGAFRTSRTNTAAVYKAFCIFRWNRADPPEQVVPDPAPQFLEGLHTQDKRSDTDLKYITLLPRLIGSWVGRMDTIRPTRSVSKRYLTIRT